MHALVQLVSFLVLAGLIVVAGPAAAEETGAAEDSTVASAGPADERTPGIKSGKTALMWSLLGTVVPYVTGSLYRNDHNANLTSAVIAGGLIIGPSLGHFYSSRRGPAWVGIGIRTLAGAAAGAAAQELADEGNNYDLVVVGVVGGILGTASLVWDIASAPHSAQVHNDHLRRGHAAFGISPSIGATGLGLRAEVSF